MEEMTMRNYSTDFKKEAVQLSEEIGCPATAEQLGLPITTLYGWRKNISKYDTIAFVGSGNKRIDPGDMEKYQMQKRIKELESANDILKKALAFFAETQKK